MTRYLTVLGVQVEYDPDLSRAGTPFIRAADGIEFIDRESGESEADHLTRLFAAAVKNDTPVVISDLSDLGIDGLVVA